MAGSGVHAVLYFLTWVAVTVFKLWVFYNCVCMYSYLLSMYFMENTKVLNNAKK